jgi:hypothetical protein
MCSDIRYSLKLNSSQPTPLEIVRGTTCRNEANSLLPKGFSLGMAQQSRPGHMPPGSVVPPSRKGNNSNPYGVGRNNMHGGSFQTLAAKSKIVPSAPFDKLPSFHRFEQAAPANSDPKPSLFNGETKPSTFSPHFPHPTGQIDLNEQATRAHAKPRQSQALPPPSGAPSRKGKEREVVDVDDEDEIQNSPEPQARPTGTSSRTAQDLVSTSDDPIATIPAGNTATKTQHFEDLSDSKSKRKGMKGKSGVSHNKPGSNQPLDIQPIKHQATSRKASSPLDFLLSGICFGLCPYSVHVRCDRGAEVSDSHLIMNPQKLYLDGLMPDVFPASAKGSARVAVSLSLQQIQKWRARLSPPTGSVLTLVQFPLKIHRGAWAEDPTAPPLYFMVVMKKGFQMEPPFNPLPSTVFDPHAEGTSVLRCR